MPAPPLAHLGHWYVSLPVFMGPVLLIALALRIQTWRERRYGPDTSGKRSTVTVTESAQTATITVAGPLDYPAVLELETELGAIAPTAHEVLLDLQHVTVAGQEAAWSLCDTVARVRGTSHVQVALPCSGAHVEVLRGMCASEGIELAHARGPSASGA